MNLGLLYTRREKYSDAYNSFRRVLDEAEAINNMGYICLMEGHYDIAERLFQAAIEKSPSYFVAANENLKTVAELRD
jgi:Flp pilus assembly protein TadD